MNPRIISAILLAICIFALYSWISTKTDAFDINSQQYEPVSYVEKVPSPQPTIVAPSGPATPSQYNPEMMPRIQANETPFDPQDDKYESPNAPSTLRQPERMFGPGVVNDGTDVPVSAGIASNANQVTMKAYQKFGPDFAQNGTLFMENGVMANDITVENSYSSV